MGEPLWNIGELFAGKYRIETVLGQGGMGLVLGARHVRLDEPVAIKVLLPAVEDIPGVVDRFLREARAAAKIKSAHVARVIDVDTLPSGVPFIVMEWLDGVDLAVLCKQRGVLEIEQAVRYVLEACDAVAEAHARGIVHRDLKPGNLFLAQMADGSSMIKVLDFGVSKLASDEEEHAVTAAGATLGSPSYMSPEQMRSARDVDPRTDIWALGAVLFRLLTGRPPFRAESLEELRSVVTSATLEPPSALRAGVPPALDDVLVRCLQKDREGRFGSVAELAVALVPFAGDGARWRGVSGRATLVSITPASDPFGPRSGPRSASPSVLSGEAPRAVAAEPAKGSDDTTAPERRDTFESSDSAPLGQSAMRGEGIGTSESTVPPEPTRRTRWAPLAGAALLGALTLVVLAIRIHFAVRAAAPIAAGAVEPVVASAAAPLAVTSMPALDAGAVEPVVVSAATIESPQRPPSEHPPAAAPLKRLPQPAPAPRKVTPPGSSSRDPFGGGRK